MRLKINGFTNQLEFLDEKVNVLIIKDTKCFSNIIQNINDKIDGNDINEVFLLDNCNNELKFQNEMYIVTDLFNIDFNSKKILTKLYDKISENIEKNNDIELQSLFIDVRKRIVEEINELPFEFIMTDNIDIVNILKLYSLKIDVLLYKTILEKLEFLIDLNATLNLFSVIVVPNLKIYLEKDELVELYKYSLYNNVKLLLIEKDFTEKLDYENVLVIDEEFEDFMI